MRAASWRPPHVIQWPKLIYTCIGDTTMEISVGDRVEFKNGVVGIVIHIGPSDGMCYSRDNGRAISVKIVSGTEPTTGLGKTGLHSGWENQIVGSDFLSPAPQPQPRLVVAVSPTRTVSIPLPEDQLCGCGEPWGTCDGNSPYCG